MKFSRLSVSFFVLIMFMSVIPVATANTDLKPIGNSGECSNSCAADTNLEMDDSVDLVEWDGSEDCVPWEYLNKFSKEALMVSYDMDVALTDLPKHISDWNELGRYLKSQGLQVETDNTLSPINLEPGTHILLNDKPFKFLKIDTKNTTEGVVYLEDLEHTYTLPLLWFEKKIRGYGIDTLTITKNTSIHPPKDITLIELSSNPQTSDLDGLITSCDSAIKSGLYDWNRMDSDSRIQKWAAHITDGISDPILKAKKIFEYVRDNIKYSKHYNTKQSPITTYTQKEGNCCEKSMLTAVLTRAAAPNIEIQYQFCPDGRVRGSGWRVGHVWNAHFLNDKWKVSDATFSRCIFAEGNSRCYTKYAAVKTYHYLPF